MDADSLEALFVGRERLLGEVVKRIVSTTLSDERHFFLLIGPRGSGKTHFVNLMHHRLRVSLAQNNSSDQLLIAYLNEEEWGVASYLDLLVRVVQSLGVEAEGMVAEIRARHRLGSSSAIAYAEELLVRLAAKRPIVLICENLQDLFEGIELEGQQRLRALIQQHPILSIVATTPALFADIQSRESPFYGFFTIRRLARIDFGTALELLQKKAVHEARQDLIAMLKTPVGRARVRAIHHLAGGNHRIYVVLFDFLDQESLDDLVGPFLKMVDDLTPYYQERMRHLTSQQRKLLEYLSRRIIPTQVKRIAEECLMSEQTAAKQLGEMAKAGFLSRHQRGRESFYELAEPLMRICIEVKDNRSKHLSLFVEFLRNWFSFKELLERSVRNSGATVHAAHLQVAIKSYQEDHRDPFLDSLTSEAEACVARGEIDVGIDSLQKVVEERGEADDYFALTFALRQNDRLSEAVIVSEEGLSKYDNLRLHWERGCCALLQGDYERVLHEMEKYLAKRPDDIGGLCNRGQALLNLERYSETVANELKLLKIDPKHTHAYGVLARAYLGDNQFERAIEWADRAISENPEELTLLGVKGESLFQLGRFDEAITTFRRVLSIRSDIPNVLCRLASCYVQTDANEEAIAACRHLISVEPDHFHAYYDLAIALDNASRKEESIEAVRTLGVLEPLPYSHLLASIAELATREHSTDLVPIVQTMIDRGITAECGIHIERASLGAARGGGPEIAERLLPHVDPSVLSWRSKAARAHIDIWRHGYRNAIPAVKDFIQTIGMATDEDVSVELASIVVAGYANFRKEFLEEGVAWIVEAIPAGRQGSIMSRVIIGVVVTIADGGKLGSEWGAILEQFRSHLKSPECYTPLDVMSAAIEFGTTGDDKALLGLPVEVRALLRAEEEEVD